MPSQTFDPAAVRAELERFRAQKAAQGTPASPVQGSGASAFDPAAARAELERFRAQKAAQAPAPASLGGGVLSTIGNGAVAAGKAIAMGLADTALQPARFLERTGKAIGTIGLSDEQKAKVDAYLGPGLQEQAFGKDYATPTYRTGKEVAGGAVQAAANLATPFLPAVARLETPFLPALSRALPAVKYAKYTKYAVPTLSGAALTGGRSAEQGNSGGAIALDSLIGGGVGAGTTAVASGLGKVIEKGKRAVTEPVAGLKDKAFKGAFPKLTNIPKTDVDWALKNQDKVLPKIKYIREAVAAGEPEAADAAMREELLAKARDVASVAKSYASQNYENGVNAIADKYKGAKIDRIAVMDKAMTAAKQQGRPVFSADEKMAWDAVREALSGSGDDTIRGTIKLKQDLSSMMDGLKEGSPAMRLARNAWEAVDDQLNKITGGEMKPVNAAYAEFKHAMDQIKPAWSRDVNDDTALNFVSKLGTSSKTGAMKAIKYLEQVGGFEEGALSTELKATSIAKKMNWEKAPPGSRMRDDAVRGVIQAAGTLAGGITAGPVAAYAGQGAASAAATKLTSPAYLSQYLFNEVEKKAGKVAGPVRQAIADIIGSPEFAQIIQRAALGGPK
jgi:hypothetical protein